MRNLDSSTTKEQVVVTIAEILRGDDYIGLWGPTPANLEVQLHGKNNESGIKHSGTGRFTVAVKSVAFQFLQEYGGELPPKIVRFAERQAFFKQSDDWPDNDIVQRLRRTLYIDPYEQAEKQRAIEEAEANRIRISRIEFGWECREKVFSCEWEKPLDPLGSIGYDIDKREFRINFGSNSIALRSAQINWTSCGMDGPLPVIYFNLGSHPIFEEEVTVSPGTSFTRTRISSLDPGHERVAAYTSLAIRVVCDSPSLKKFRTLCRISPLGRVSGEVYRKEYRQLFSVELMTKFDSWLAGLDFEVAFQVEKIARDLQVDFREILALQQEIGDLVRSRGAKHTVGVLRSLHSALKESTWDVHPDYIPALFHTTAREYKPEPDNLAIMAFEDTFSCYHVSVTPTAMKLSGPFQERSNRVLRRYPDQHSCFLRVTFEEETRLQLRFDREVDGATFVKKRYGTILRETGLKIAGRRHRFLAYSQSALKHHSVWFMRPFKDKDGALVDPAFIIDSLGDFDNSSDPKLIYCPGRYGARISQAFTATDSSISIQPGEIHRALDIEVLKDPDNPSSGKWNFTDGVGTVSPELAKEIWDTICARRKSARQVHIYPSASRFAFKGARYARSFLLLIVERNTNAIRSKGNGQR